MPLLRMLTMGLNLVVSAGVWFHASLKPDFRHWPENRWGLGSAWRNAGNAWAIKWAGLPKIWKAIMKSICGFGRVS